MNARQRPLIVQVLTNKNRFGIFFVGAALSNIGTWCQNLAAILLVYRLSGSVLIVGLVSVAQFTAPVLLAPWAGLAADRFERRRILMTTQLSGSLISAVLAAVTLTGRVSVPIVLVALGLLGVCQAFQAPAQLSITPLMVATDHRELGLSLNSSQFNLARAIGPIVANAIVLSWGVGAAFVFNTVSFFAYVLALQFIRPARQAKAKGHPRLRETLAVVRSERALLPLLLSGFVISGATDVVATLGPPLAIDLTGSDAATGWLITGFGIGGVVTAFFVVSWLRRFPRRLPVTVAVEAVGIGGLALAPSLPIAMGFAAIAGGAFLASSNRALSLVQGLTPAPLLGRVMALWLVAFLGGRPVFALIEGLVASVANARTAGLVIAGMVLMAAGAIHLDMRRWVRPADADTSHRTGKAVHE